MELESSWSPAGVQLESSWSLVLFERFLTMLFSLVPVNGLFVRAFGCLLVFFPFRLFICMFGCLVVWLFGCLVVWLCVCLFVLLCFS